VHVEALLGLGEPGGHGLFGELLQAELLLPVVQGRGRRAERAGPVDDGGATHATPLQDGDGSVHGAAAGAILVEVGVGLALLLVEVGAGAQRALFDDDHVEAGLGQDLGGDAGSGTRADDGDVALDLSGQVGGAIDGLPAFGQAFAKRIREFAHMARGPG
jgi:hypothetical protein